MKNINRVIFASGSGTSRSPMATAIFHSFPHARPIICEARGLIVQFPEPLNQKAEAVVFISAAQAEDCGNILRKAASDYSDSIMLKV